MLFPQSIKPNIVAILNITPDSFSDGNQHNNIQNAISYIEYAYQYGARVIDIGAESTRPNADIISETEEQTRLLEIFHWIKTSGKKLYPDLEWSIDTRNPTTAELALKSGFDIINDVTGFVNYEMVALAGNHDIKIIAMHSLSVPSDPNIVISKDDDEVEAIKQWGVNKIENLTAAGIARNNIILDVGIGFGKTAIQSLNIIRRVAELYESWQTPILVGHSRKSFLQELVDDRYINLKTDDPDFMVRDALTAYLSKMMVGIGAVKYLRVHNVGIYKTLKM